MECLATTDNQRMLWPALHMVMVKATALAIQVTWLWCPAQDEGVRTW
ncbi:hypothetical protein RSAG8_13994, partial [Rhizoctonia solani AG-8 WAC10335]